MADITTETGNEMWLLILRPMSGEDRKIDKGRGTSDL